MTLRESDWFSALKPEWKFENVEPGKPRSCGPLYPDRAEKSLLEEKFAGFHSFIQDCLSLLQKRALSELSRLVGLYRGGSDRYSDYSHRQGLALPDQNALRVVTNEFLEDLTVTGEVTHMNLAVAFAAFQVLCSRRAFKYFYQCMVICK